LVNEMSLEKWKTYILNSGGLAAILFIFLIQLNSINPFAASWDQVDFSLALERFDLRAMQPHFPGYPYFILGGMLLNGLVNTAPQALVLFNILIYASSVIPMFLLASRLISRRHALLTAAVIYTASYPLVIVNEPMSEGAALAALWWYFWSIVIAIEKPAGKWTLLPLFLFSILLGVRLSYIPMGVGLVYLLFEKWREKQINWAGIIKYLAIAAAFQLIWVVGLIFSEGGVTNFLELAFGFTGGHFQEWGGTCVSNELSLFARLKFFLFTNIFWWGIFSRTPVLMVLYIVIGILIFLPGKKSRVYLEQPYAIAIIMMLSYGIWALFAQNIDKPRHILPVALLLLFLGITAFFRKRKSFLAGLLILSLVIAQAMTAAPLVKKQATEQPAVYQLARFLEGQETEFVLYTWEETRVLEYLDMPFPHKRVYTYNVFLHDQSLYKGRSVYMTGSVVEGFEAQGIDMDGKAKKIELFASDKMFDPVYHEIILYKWTP
jgi:hypothetical protein